MKKIYWLVLIGVVVATGIFSTRFLNNSTAPSQPAEETNSTVKDSLPQFSLNDYAGKTFSSEEFANQPLIVNTWATWCPFCVKELPDFATLQAEFSDDLTIIAINRQESISRAKEFSDRLEVSDKFIFLMDPRDSFYRDIGAFSMPETLFVNAAGEIVFHKRGPMDLTEMREKANSIIK